MALKHLITCVVAGIDYLVHPQILGAVEESVRADQIIPVVVLSEEEISAGPEKLWDTLHDLVAYDDVCTDEFTGIIVVKPSTSSASEPAQYSLNNAAAQAQAQAVEVALNGTVAAVYRLSPSSLPGYTRSQQDGNGNGKPELVSGPYFLSGQNLHQAWRLYPDEHEAFVYGVLPEDPVDPMSFQAIAPQASDGLTKSIPVPSRHYNHHRNNPNKPLAGSRISIQDNLALQGTTTTLSSRAWTQLHSEEATTSTAYVEWLLAQGAVVIGKTKMAQFVTAREWVDYQSPVNPRGDGYQEASGGAAAGAAAALAGYAWLDYAVGLDSIGDVRGPATQYGLHAMRTTLGSASLDDTATISPRYDTLGLFARSLNDLSLFVNQSLAASTTDNAQARRPPRIIYPTDFYPLPDPDHQKFMDLFMEKLEIFTGFQKNPISFDKLWDESPPLASKADSAGEGLQDFMQKAPMWSFAREFSNFIAEFRHDYRDSFNRSPFIEASARFWSDLGANVTHNEYHTHLNRINIFKTWFDTNVLSLDHNPGTLQDGILVLPYGTAEPRYRDVPPREPTMFSPGLTPEILSSILGTPHLVVCFAQIPYPSRISETTEYKPICASIMGARGTDAALVNFAREALEAAGWRTDITTGRLMYPLGQDNGRNVDDAPESDDTLTEVTEGHTADEVVFELSKPTDEL
ncbi:amidase signature domain-containing protein [Coniella lustricola]|uniref:Amidase signature domain-containing protein n=1 Tax=Coniella lustricola TaxID=2025994 RepID=A0A2T3A4Y0_9PEZI|nr:amidase signature domain-containing protein [Coniella lustricola]